jgi:hypothetical protein
MILHRRWARGIPHSTLTAVTKHPSEDLSEVRHPGLNPSASPPSSGSAVAHFMDHMTGEVRWALLQEHQDRRKGGRAPLRYILRG